MEETTYELQIMTGCTHDRGDWHATCPELKRRLNNNEVFVRTADIVINALDSDLSRSCHRLAV